MRIVKLDEASKQNILADLLKRDPNNYGTYADTVQEIVNSVKRDGDRRYLPIQRNLIRRT